jgi:hypothetical protein
MTVRAFACLSVLLLASEAGATQCRTIVRGTFIQTFHPNGAVSMGRADPGETFIVINCMPEGTQVWCQIQETERTVFTVRRFLEAGRLDGRHSKVVDFAECLASGG